MIATEEDPLAIPPAPLDLAQEAATIEERPPGPALDLDPDLATLEVLERTIVPMATPSPRISKRVMLSNGYSYLISIRFKINL